MEEVKKLSYNIERTGYDCFMRNLNYVYKFETPQYLEQLDDFSDFGINQNDVKEAAIEQLLIGFKIALNNAIYGEPAGRAYIENIKQ